MNKKGFADRQLKNWVQHFSLPAYLLARAIDQIIFDIKADGCGVSVVTCKWRMPDQELEICTTPQERNEISKRRQWKRERKKMKKLRRLSRQKECRWLGVDPGRRDVMIY